MGNHPCEQFPQENYYGEYLPYINHQSEKESDMVYEQE